MIRITHLVKSYGHHPVLKGVNIEVNKGEIYGFIGQNGAGKSTTMNILTGLIDFQEGECIVNGRNVRRNEKRTFNDIGYLPEDPKFYPYMNSWEYLSFIGTMGGYSKKHIKETSGKLLDLVKLRSAAKRTIGGYSRGMRQRFGIAAAMFHNPRVLLLDEPYSALDPQGRMDVTEIILRLKEEGRTIFLSSHILNDIERICNKIGILSGGRIVLEENLDTLMKKYMKPIYDIEFITPPDQERLKTLLDESRFNPVLSEDGKISICLTDIHRDSSRLTGLIADTGIPVVSMKLRKDSLEDIFLRVVNGS